MSEKIEGQGLDVLTRLTLAWVRVYTAGLPGPICERRFQQIRSDLWEHHAAWLDDGETLAVIRIEVVVRWLAGMLADINWRVDAGRFERQRRKAAMKEVQRDQSLFIMSLFAATLPVALGIAVVAGMGADGPYGRQAFGGVMMMTGVVMVAGLLLSERRPLLIGIGRPRHISSVVLDGVHHPSHRHRPARIRILTRSRHGLAPQVDRIADTVSTCGRSFRADRFLRVSQAGSAAEVSAMSSNISTTCRPSYSCLALFSL